MRKMLLALFLTALPVLQAAAYTETKLIRVPPYQEWVEIITYEKQHTATGFKWVEISRYGYWECYAERYFLVTFNEDVVDNWGMPEILYAQEVNMPTWNENYGYGGFYGEPEGN